MGEIDEIRYDNLDLIDFEGRDYIEFLEDKYLTAKLVIPYKIIESSRNNQLSAIAYQLRALNPNFSKERILGFIKAINLSRCSVPLKEKEINTIVNKVMKPKYIEPILNSPRLIIFNRESELSLKERRILTNRAIGKSRRLKTLKELKNVVSDWNIYELGRITQSKLAKVSNRNIKTIQQYYKELRPLIKEINSKAFSKTTLSKTA